MQCGNLIGSCIGGTEHANRVQTKCFPDIFMTNAMTLEELQAIDSRCRYEKPKLLELSRSDPPAALDELDVVEESIGTKLPKSYRDFLAAFGGGTVGLAVIFSAYADGDWYLPDRQRAAEQFLPTGLLAFSDDFAGGYYVFKVADEIADERPWYWNQDGGLVQTEFANVYEFVARYAYEPA